jgi:hypothetical protein
MYKKSLSLLFGLLATVLVSAQDKTEFFSEADTFFQTYVTEGRVDYQAIAQSPEELNSLLGLAKVMITSKDNVKEYQAFWVNAYNLLVIKSVVDNYPIRSPLDKVGFFDGTKHEIGGTQVTLNDIEHKMLRAVFPKEPRFHFVLVCAGLGCPPIINKAYLPKTLNDQLENQTLLALNDSDFIQVKNNKVKVSQIFEWYNDDFTQDGKSLVDFINVYKTEKLPANSKISFYEYDWSLNEKD